MSANAPRHLSMLRTFRLADLVTLMNGFCGAGALLAFMSFCATGEQPMFWVGTALLPVAFVMDALDGWIARRTGKGSVLGKDLDSLADIVSFGVAPAGMAFAAGMRGGWDAVCLVFFVGCGISRLARFNVTAAELTGPKGKVTHFEGLPIPTSLLQVVALAVLAGAGLWQDRLPLGALSLGPFRLHPWSLLYVLHGSGMISKTLRIPKP
ncbi:MAG TPA: CDP-alcohol phosphatidyltransferase family protein [Polyangia bacterium]|nr:CDP-alcohol phosphatidyltransferase family protein [Polyangia bacterium]